MSQTIDIEVVYCSDTTHLQRIQLPADSRVSDALSHPGLLQGFGLSDTSQLRFGIFGKVCERDQLLQAHDRIEIYRPLLLSPTEARRLRAKTRLQK